MNVLAACHAAIRTKMLTNISRVILEVTGFTLLWTVDWRAALGVYLLLNGFAMRQKDTTAP